MKTIVDRRMMRTPVILVAGQGDTPAVAAALLDHAKVVVEHRFDGHVVRRRIISSQADRLVTIEAGLELVHGCVSCTIRNDLPGLLRQLHHQSGVDRIVVRLVPWLEPAPFCWAINHVCRADSGYIDGPAARDVVVAAVVTCIDAENWLEQALGDDELSDGRTVAQVVVGQAEFADVVVLDAPEPTTLAALRRLAPRARMTVGTKRVEMALAHLEPDSRRGRHTSPHDPLLAGQPPLHADGHVRLVEFNAYRPFHPQRLHTAVDLLLDGVIRTRGRMWLASQPEYVMWLESAGGGLQVGTAGKWLAAMTPAEADAVDAERRALADLIWHDEFGDRHTAMTVLVCGAEPDEILAALTGALLTDDEILAFSDPSRYDDPFGDWHQDPCPDFPQTVQEASGHNTSEEDRS